MSYRVYKPGIPLRIVAAVLGTPILWAFLLIAMGFIVVASIFIPFAILFGEWKVKQK